MCNGSDLCVRVNLMLCYKHTCVHECIVYSSGASPVGALFSES